jgi:hypothetical protein
MRSRFPRSAATESDHAQSVARGSDGLALSGAMQTITKRKIPLPAHLVRKVSVEAPADPRTIRALLLGRPVSPLARERIERALRHRGLMHLVPGVER